MPLPPPLDAYAPADDLERAHLDAMRDLARQPGCASRARYQPGHFTASAFVLSPERDALLLLHHAKLGRWLQPGGHIEPGDATFEQAARREVAEEVGLEALELLADGPFDLDVHRIPARRDEPEHLHFDIRYLFRSPSLDAVAGDGALGVRWVPLDQVSAEDSDESVWRATRKLIRASAGSA